MRTHLKVLVGLLCLGNLLPAAAQFHREPTPNDTLQSVRVTDDGKITLSIYAPQAKEVNVGGDAVPWGQKLDVVKADNGVWSVELPAVKTGVYRYNFVVDGVKVYDPKGTLAAETSAILEVDPTGDSFFALKDVPHGAVAQRYYYSKSLQAQRRMHVWTPAGYETSTEKLPVFYLIHGGGDYDNAWSTIGRAGFILDNLFAEGKIQPMIVVMPCGTIHTDSLEGEVPLFVNDLINDIIPYVEANYRVIADKDHRALGGLSMGGLETLETAMDHYQKFAYLYVLSSGWFSTDTENYAKKGAHLKEIAADFNATVKELIFTMGGEEDIAYKNCKEMLKLFDAAGIKYQYTEQPGGHSWYVWRNDLYTLSQRLFK